MNSIQVLSIRDNEITVVKKSSWLISIVAFISTLVPFTVALASFATYIFIDEGNTLTAKKAFITLSYLVNIAQDDLCYCYCLIHWLIPIAVIVSQIFDRENVGQLLGGAVNIVYGNIVNGNIEKTITSKNENRRLEKH